MKKEMAGFVRGGDCNTCIYDVYSSAICDECVPGYSKHKPEPSKICALYAEGYCGKSASPCGIKRLCHYPDGIVTPNR